MPKRKTKKHKRIKRIKYKNKHKKSSSSVRKIPADLWNLIVALMTSICPNHHHDYATMLAHNILCNTLSDRKITRWCDPNVDSRKINYFTYVSFNMASNSAKIYSNKEMLAPADVAFYLLSCCLHVQHHNYIDKCVEWCIEFFQSTDRPTCYLDISDRNVMYVASFEEPFVKYFIVKRTSVKAKLFPYLTLIGELFNRNIISNTFIYDKILNSSVSRDMHEYVHGPLETINIEILHHLCKICGNKLYEESKNKIMELIYSGYGCEICLELVHVKVLPIPCGHVLCADCMIMKGIIEGKCPMCGKQFDSPVSPEFQLSIRLINEIKCMFNVWNSIPANEHKNEHDTPAQQTIYSHNSSTEMSLPVPEMKHCNPIQNISIDDPKNVCNESYTGPCPDYLK
eukprot:294404_1